MSFVTPRRVADRYELRSVLGRGGVGVVWLAEDLLLGRQVAVKEVLVAAHLPDAERHAARARVAREARAAARLNHPGVVRLYDVITVEDSTYLVMELVQAPTLAQLVEEQGTLPPARAAAIGLALLSALDAAHAAGIVHRDVKPGNVMIAEGDAAMLTDFGVARLADDPALTATGLVVGSPGFMAPEQAGEGPLTSAVDFWGLGATLYFAVEGRPPFDRGAAIPTLHAVVTEDLPPAEHAGPLAPVLVELLDKDPARRPGSVALRQALEVVAAGPLPAPRERVPLPLPPPPLRRSLPVIPAAVTLAVLALLAAAALLLFRGDQSVADSSAVAAGSPDLASPAPSVTAPATAVTTAVLPPTPASTEFSTPAPPAPVTLQPEPTAEATAEREDVPATEAPAPSPPQATPPAPETEPEPTPTTEDQPPRAQDALPAGVPDDWVVYTDPAIGYSVAHPPGWTIEDRAGNLTDIRDPVTRSYLRLDWTDTPPASPEGAWAELSAAFSRRFGGSYTEIGITPMEFRGFDAAYWEYTYADGGAQLHAGNLGIATGPRGYALNFQTRADRWEESQDLYEAFQASFQPAPPG